MAVGAQLRSSRLERNIARQGGAGLTESHVMITDGREE